MTKIYCVSKSTLSITLNRFINVVNNKISAEIVAWPETLEERSKIPHRFYKAKFPNICGIIDGSLIPIKCPKNDEN